MIQESVTETTTGLKHWVFKKLTELGVSEQSAEYLNMLILVLVGQAIIQHNMIANIMMLIIKVVHQKIMKKIVGYLIQ